MSCGDQGVVAAERAQLDLWLATSLAAEEIERYLLGCVGEGKATGEAVAVAAGELARGTR